MTIFMLLVAALIFGRLTLAQPTCNDEVHRRCCSYREFFGMVPFVTWGQTPESYKQWHTDHDCDNAKCPCVPPASERTFARVRDAAIPWHNVEKLGPDLTPEDCKRECLKRSWCKSFDYVKRAVASAAARQVMECDLSDVTAADVGGLKTDYAGNPYDHYTLQNDMTSACTGADLERTSGKSCCEGLLNQTEKRQLADPLYCTATNPQHGLTCFSTRQMCRPDYCTKEVNVDYTGNDLPLGGFGGRFKGHLRSAEVCRQACIDTPLCKAWTFVKNELVKDNCNLKFNNLLSFNRNYDDCCDSGVICRVKSFKCLDLKMPTSDEIISQHCSPGLIDALLTRKQRTGRIPVTMSLTDGQSLTKTRSTKTAFTQEHGWNLQQIDSSMHESSSSTEVTVKDPATSSNFEFGIDGFSVGGGSSTSCMNKNTEVCSATSNYGLQYIRSWFGVKDEDCKCTETTTTNSETFSDTHTTTQGVMASQSATQESGFDVSFEKYTAITATWMCPEYSECVYTQYTSTIMCSIPYWGTCTSVFEELDPMLNNVQKQVEIKRNDKNKYLITKSAHSSTTYVRSSSIVTDGSSCGIQLTPAVDNSSTAKFREYLSCPTFQDIESLPNCDCMLSRFKDCITRTHPNNVLERGEKCQLGNRLLSDYDDAAACLHSQPNWVNVRSCSGSNVYYVAGFNKAVYGELLKGIRGSFAKPDVKVTYYFDMVRDFAWTAQHDTSGGYVHDGSVLLDGNDSTFWNVVGMPAWNFFWYVVFDSNSEDTVVSQFKIKNFGDGTHDAQRVLLQCSNDEVAITSAIAAASLPGSTFTLSTGHSDWQTFANSNHSACRYWKVAVLGMANTPWLREVSFVTSSGSGRRLQDKDGVKEGHLFAPL